MNTEITEPFGAGWEAEFTDPSEFNAKAIDPNGLPYVGFACASSGRFKNRLGLAKVRGSPREGDDSGFLFRRISATPEDGTPAGTAKLICVAETYSSGAGVEPKLTSTPDSTP